MQAISRTSTSNKVTATINGNTVTHMVKKYSSEMLNIFYNDDNNSHTVRIGTSRGVYRTGEEIYDAGDWRNNYPILVDLNCDVDIVTVNYSNMTKVTVIGNVNNIDVNGNVMVTNGVRSCQSNAVVDRPDLYESIGYRRTVDEVKRCGNYNTVLFNHTPIHTVQIETPVSLSLIIRSNKVIQKIQGRCDVYVKGQVNTILGCQQAIAKVGR